MTPILYYRFFINLVYNNVLLIYFLDFRKSDLLSIFNKLILFLLHCYHYRLPQILIILIMISMIARIDLYKNQLFFDNQYSLGKIKLTHKSGLPIDSFRILNSFFSCIIVGQTIKAFRSICRRHHVNNLKRKIYDMKICVNLIVAVVAEKRLVQSQFVQHL